MTTRAVFYSPRGRSRVVAYGTADKAARGKSRASIGYQAIAARYLSQPDVVRHLLALFPSDLRYYRDMRSMYGALSHHHSTY